LYRTVQLPPDFIHARKLAKHAWAEAQVQGYNMPLIKLDEHATCHSPADS
jgi:hypothetical protein